MGGKLPIGEALVSGPYARPALIPRSPWLDDTPPAAPTVTVQRGDGRCEVKWQPQGDEPAFVFVVYAKLGSTWTERIVSGDKRSAVVKGPVSAVAVTAVDRCRNESGQHAVPVPEAR